MSSSSMDGNKNIIVRLVRIAIFSALIVAQEELLSFIPNVQFTQVLIAIYFACFGLTDTLCIVFIHCLLDNLIVGSFSLLYTPAMIVGWVLLVLILFLFRKVKNRIVISLIVGLHGFIYSWCFLVVSCFVYKMPLVPYLIEDLPFEIILVVNGFVTTLVLYKPLTTVLDSLLKNKRS